MNLVGQTLGHYRIVTAIGAGATATVYRAYQKSLERYVAIKVLPVEQVLPPGLTERFFAEARAVMQLNHPHIVPVYDVGIEGEVNYIVMRLVDGQTLADLPGRPMPTARAVHYLAQVATALDYAHANAIIHYDIKPSNMLLEGDQLLLSDFGITGALPGTPALEGDNLVLGTPAYMAPEQAQGLATDHRSDIYSLGVVLYELLTGRVPFQAANTRQVMAKHVHEQPPPPRNLNPNITVPVEQVLLKALAKSPDERYNSATALAAALREAISSPATFVPGADGTSRRNSSSIPMIAVIILVVVLLIGGGVLFYIWWR